MPQAYVDPEELERFARNLKQFNEELRNNSARLQGQFAKLGDVWRDQEHARFAHEFQQTLGKLHSFMLTADTFTPFLLRKAQQIRAYFSQRPSGSSSTMDKWSGASSVKASDTHAFSISDWSAYPTTVPKPTGPFRLLSGDEYRLARQEGDRATQRYHREYPEAKGKEIHHIQPIKFGGDPWDTNNLIVLSDSDHDALTVWWKHFQRDLKQKGIL